MANYSALGHSKTLGKPQIPNFSTIASTLTPLRLKSDRPLPLEGKCLQVHLSYADNLGQSLLDERLGDVAAAEEQPAATPSEPPPAPTLVPVPAAASAPTPMPEPDIEPEPEPLNVCEPVVSFPPSHVATKSAWAAAGYVVERI